MWMLVGDDFEPCTYIWSPEKLCEQIEENRLMRCSRGNWEWFVRSVRFFFWCCSPWNIEWISKSWKVRAWLERFAAVAATSSGFVSLPSPWSNRMKTEMGKIPFWYRTNTTSSKSEKLIINLWISNVVRWFPWNSHWNHEYHLSFCFYSSFDRLFVLLSSYQRLLHHFRKWVLSFIRD